MRIIESVAVEAAAVEAVEAAMLAGDAAHVLSSVPRVLMSSQSIVRGQHGDGPGRVPTSTPSDV